MKTESGPGMIPGVDVSAIEAVLMQNRVKMIVLTPDFHNPTGTTCRWRNAAVCWKSLRGFKFRLSKTTSMRGCVPAGGRFRR